MSLPKKVFIILTGAALVFIYGCGSQETQQKTDSKPAVEQQAAESTTEVGTKELKPQTTCPVMGGEIDKELYVEKNGKRIYMCCEHCREELTENFEKYLKKLEEEMGQKAETL